MAHSATMAQLIILATLASLSSYAAADDALTEQVLVTATRVETNGNGLPMAWSAISKEALELTGHVHINEVMQLRTGRSHRSN